MRNNRKKGQRYFSGRQKVVLFLQAQGKCLMCGNNLENGWHADHSYPWSKGGQTEIRNGQALCPGCNLTKSDKEIFMPANSSK